MSDVGSIDPAELEHARRLAVALVTAGLDRPAVDTPAAPDHPLSLDAAAVAAAEEAVSLGDDTALAMIFDLAQLANWAIAIAAGVLGVTESAIWEQMVKAHLIPPESR